MGPMLPRGGVQHRVTLGRLYPLALEWEELVST